MMNQIIVQRHGLPPFLSYIEAAGQAQGGAADASAGLNKVTDDRGTWAWNPLYSEWQLLHIVRSGDTVWQMGATYYGQSSLTNVHRIGNIEQNFPLLGSTYDQAVPGDVLLIPGLAQPSGQPPAPAPGGAVPPPGGAMPPDEPGLAPDVPDWWPPNLPWPPYQTQPEVPGGQEMPGEVPGEPADQAPPPQGVPVGAITPRAPEKKSWWTGGKIALVGGLGLTALGLIVWGATRGQKRTTRRTSTTRRRPPQRRRRRR